MKRITALLIILALFVGCQQTRINKTTNQIDNKAPSPSLSSLEWTQLVPGISWSQTIISINKKQKQFFIVSIDPEKFRFTIYQNQDQNNAKTIREIHKEKNAILTFNGSFWGENFKPVGFLKSNGEKYGKLSAADLLNGVFTISNSKKPKLFHSKNFKDSDTILFALQNDPILSNENSDVQTQSEIGKTAARTALGIDKNNKIVLIVIKSSVFQSENTITLLEFANILQTAHVFKNLGLYSVLNLDGGPSSGFMIKDHYYSELHRVQNVVVIQEH